MFRLPDLMRLLTTPLATRPAVLGLCLLSTTLGSCSDGGDARTTASETTPPAKTQTTPPTRTTPAQKRPALEQVLRVTGPGAKGEPGSSVSPERGQGVLLRVLARPESGRGELDVRISRTGARTHRVRATIVGTDERVDSEIEVPSSRDRLVSFSYGCALPPATICPFERVRRTDKGARLRTEIGERPVLVNLAFGRPGSVPTPKPIPLGPPAPGAPVQATVTVAAPPKERGAKPPPPGPETRTAAGQIVRTSVRVAPQSPRRGRLRIAIPRTSGRTIEVLAGGTAGDPAARAKIVGKDGPIRIADVRYRCGLPPATFCPIRTVKVTGTGLIFALPTPEVPVSLIFEIAAG